MNNSGLIKKIQVAAVTLTATVALVTPTAAVGAEVTPSQTTQSTTLLATPWASEVTPAQTTQSTTLAAATLAACGFNFWGQSYKNCSGKRVNLAVNINESQTLRNKTYYTSVCERSTRYGLNAMWGWLATAVYANQTNFTCGTAHKLQMH